MKRFGLFAGVFVVLAAWLFVIGCEQAGPGTERELVTTTNGVSCNKATGDVLDLNCPEMPTPLFSTPADYNIFAWNSFIAASWPALDPSSHNNQRGFPDTTASFAGASSTDELVWETWKEKREIFVYNEPANSPIFTGSNFTNWVSEVDYYNSTEGINMCDGSAVPANARLIAGTTKVNSLDEVEEVPSEALESGDQLCGMPDSGHCASNPTDACCQVKYQQVEPLVWFGTPNADDPGENLVRFEVKVNYDYWKKVIDNKLYIQNTADTTATGKSGPITLPYRTNETSAPTNNGVPNYTSSACLDSLGTVTSSSSVNPCSAGSFQTKAAWVPITASNGLDASDYITTEALYYSTVSATDTTLCFEQGTFGLIGLHIIQRFHEPGAAFQTPAKAAGGAYLFATWEHESVTSGYTYSNHYVPPTGSTIPEGYYPPLDETVLPVERQETTDWLLQTDLSILPSTTVANDSVHSALNCPDSGSIWCNYYLVGTQYAGYNTSDNDTTIVNDVSGSATTPSQTYYLANLVVETNYGLQKFIGTPPNVIFIDRWGIGGSTGTAYDRFGHNLAFSTGSSGTQTTYNMGGCMGCHGVVQQLGYSFSFVLQKNQDGSKPEAPPPAQ